MARVLRNATHFLGESLATITGDGKLENFTHDIGWLKDLGLSLAVVFHGSDIRSPARHIESVPSSYARLYDPDFRRILEESALFRRGVARQLGLPLFVTTPDLLEDLPEASWLPVTTSAQLWSSEPIHAFNQRLRVLHVPSLRKPPIKGTAVIDPILQRLHDEGVISYIAPTFVAHSDMPALVKSVDIVVDQVLSGYYGVAAIEAMAAGRLVIGNLGADFRKRIESPIPIVDSPPDDLEDIIRDVVRNPSKYLRVAADGPRYFNLYHSGSGTIEALSRWLIGSRN